MISVSILFLLFNAALCSRSTLQSVSQYTPEQAEPLLSSVDSNNKDSFTFEDSIRIMHMMANWCHKAIKTAHPQGPTGLAKRRKFSEVYPSEPLAIRIH